MDTERMYNNIMTKFKFGGLAENPDIYLDETVMRMCYTHRRLFAQLAMQLLVENKEDKALKVLQRAEQAIPANVVPHNFQSGSLDLAKSWLGVGRKNECGKLLDAIGQNAKEYLEWYLSLNTNRLMQSARQCMYNLYLLDEISGVYARYDEKKTDEYHKELEYYMKQCMARGINM